MSNHWTSSRDGKSYIASSSFPSKCPAGLYSLEQTSMGDTILTKIPRKEEELCMFTCGPTISLLNEMNTFWKNRPLYEKMGIAYKRSVLIHGPAGCGKSGAISRVITETIKNDGIVLLQNNFRSFGSDIVRLQEIEKGRQIVIVIEDIDKQMRYEEEEVLEIFDGNSSATGVFYISTTNYMHRLPERFVNRPSRVDSRIEFPFLSVPQKKEYLQFLGLNKNRAAEIAKASKNVTIAQLKEIVTQCEVFKTPVSSAVKKSTTKVKARKDDDY